eukprot:scaffold954_cov173-Ochromonas_danica.AAC.9
MLLREAKSKFYFHHVMISDGTVVALIAAAEGAKHLFHSVRRQYQGRVEASKYLKKKCTSTSTMPL